MWARDVISRVLSGADVEDGRVECKGEFPSEHARAARQIAALANSARSPEVMWIVGLDERGHRVTPVRFEDLADWWPQVQGRFDGSPPLLVERRVPTDAGTVLALVFDTSDVPFVVPVGGGSDRFEVPWRDGTRTRSARHGELIDILVPRLRLPRFELLEGSLEVHDYGGKEGGWSWQLVVPAYLEVDAPTILPDHRCSATVDASPSNHEWELKLDARIASPMDTFNPFPTVNAGAGDRAILHMIRQDVGQLVVEGPGRVVIRGATDRVVDRPDLSKLPELRLRVNCRPVGSELRAEIRSRLTQEYWHGPARDPNAPRGPLARWLIQPE